ncbi:outer membrane beta-barrel family protein, partial [Flavobacterium frigidarium]|uniref:outer membrane beta-barrel family protein n=1 Tax=Flavobacterium frigidarium TaxID=99286 RepID=UPI00047C77A1
SGGSAVDALKVAPRVRVQNDAISIIGKSEVRVLVNDRLIQLTGDDLTIFLKSIRAEDIQSIEVITNPPAKYEVEGNSGLLNIKLKKSKLNSFNTSIRSSYKQATYSTAIVGAGLMYQKDKIAILSDINYSKGSIESTLKNNIFYPEQLWQEKNIGRDFTNSLNYKLGIDYRLSKKISIGLLYIGNTNKPNTKENDKTQFINNRTKLLDSLIVTKSVSDREKTYNSLNTHLTYKIDSIGKNLSIDLDIFNYRNNNSREFSSNNFMSNNIIIPNSFFSAQNNGNQNISNYSINIDMEHPFKKGSFNYGSKLSFTNTNNDIIFNELTTGMPVFDSALSNLFKYEEKTQTFYSSIQKRLSEQLEAKLGIRVENTQTTGDLVTLNQINKNSYTEFFPTAYLSYQPNENNSFSLNYGRRINRPTFSWLNPFRWYSSNYSFSEGNPKLKPSFTNNIEFEFTRKDNWVNILYFSKIKDGFDYVTIVDDESKIQILSAKNYIKSSIIGLYETINLKPFKWVSTNLGLNIYYSYSKSGIPITNQSLDGWNSESSFSSDFILQKDKKILLNVAYVFTSDGVSGLDRALSSSQLNIALKLFMLKKDLQVSIVGNDILKTNKQKYIGSSNNFKTSFENYFDARYFQLSLTYNFGGKISVDEREIKNREDKERAK